MRATRQLERMARRVAQDLDTCAIPWPARGWLVALSGGADSLALWHVATALGNARGLRVEALHVDHGLRPTSASEASKVRALVQQQGQRCHVLCVQVDADGEGLEAAARRVRRQALEAVRQARGLDAILLGHTADDQAETVLMRLLVGSGVRGMAAMVMRNGHLLRPLLGVRRRDTVALVTALGLTPIDDAHNRDPRYLRAWLRHTLLPQLEGRLGDVTPHLVALAGEAAMVNALVDALLATELPVVGATGTVVAPRVRLLALAPALRTRWLLQALDALHCPARRARATVERFAELLPGRDPFEIDFAGARVVVRRGLVTVERWQRHGVR